MRLWSMQTQSFGLGDKILKSWEYIEDKFIPYVEFFIQNLI